MDADGCPGTSRAPRHRDGPADVRRPLPASLRAFAHRDFRLFFAGQLVSLVGTWMQSVAQSWLVLELTNSAFKLGVVGALQFSPMLFLSFLAGALADRLPKRRLVTTTQSVLLLQSLALGLLVWGGHVRYWHVAVMATIYGIANTVDMPARQSFIVEMVGKSDLTSAIALNSAMFNGARVVGPAVAGLVIARWGMALAFFINSGSFLAVILALLVIRAEGLPRGPSGRTVREEIAEGLVHAARTPRIALVLSLVLVVSAFLLNYNILVPLLARDVLHQEAKGFGLLMAAVGVGAVIGAFALAMLGRERPPVAVLVVPAVALGASTIALGAVSRFWVAAVVLLVMGFCGILFMAGSNTSLQLTAPDALRGRIMSLYTFVFAGVTPIGAFFVGSVIEALGVRTGMMLAGGTGAVAVALVTAWFHWRRSRSALRR